MTVSTGWRSPVWACDHACGSARALPQRLCGGAGVAGVASVCAWLLCTLFAGTNSDAALAVQDSPAQSIMRRSDPAPAMFEARFYLGGGAGFRLAAVPQPSEQQLALASLPSLNALKQDVSPAPMQTQRPTRSAAAHGAQARWRPHHRGIAQERQERVAAAPAGEPTVFEKLFGKPPAIFDKLFGAAPSGVTLAYATAGNTATDGAGVTTGLYDRQTAVYDISAHIVYMPDGTTLEAHSGLGSRLDDPRFVDERSRGATPPDVYDLKPRESPFHGVRALRLIPIDNSKVFGRSGLLAHTYMLGPNGDSNGCVSFKDYDAFLRAYESGKVKRLAVVARLD
jgi:type VI secretion system (T6SS) effector TldE1-like protein